MKNSNLMSTRVDSALMEAIRNQAEFDGISTSESIRKVLQRYFKMGPFIIQPTFNVNTGEFIEEIPFHEREEFREFTLWLIYVSKFSIALTENSLRRYHFAAEQASQDIFLSNELRFEFLKVVQDLNRVMASTNPELEQLHFIYKGNAFSFQYEILEQELKLNF